MFASSVIRDSLRRALKAEGVSLTDLAQRLGVSHATVKRWMASGNFTLKQLDDVLKATGIEWERIAAAGAAEQHLLTRLSWEQEAALVADPHLLLVAMSAMNHLSLADITSIYALTEAECLRHLLTLDRMGFLELLPNNRVKLRVTRQFEWIANGPIQRYFRTLAADFFDSDFTGDREQMSLLVGMLTPASVARVAALSRKLIEEFTRLHHRDASAPFAERRLLTLLVAARPWEAAFMRALRRPDPTAAAPARRIVRSGTSARR